jgi:hypothetical protein
MKPIYSPQQSLLELFTAWQLQPKQIRGVQNPADLGL